MRKKKVSRRPGRRTRLCYILERSCYLLEPKAATLGKHTDLKDPSRLPAEQGTEAGAELCIRDTQRDTTPWSSLALPGTGLVQLIVFLLLSQLFVSFLRKWPFHICLHVLWLCSPASASLSPSCWSPSSSLPCFYAFLFVSQCSSLLFPMWPFALKINCSRTHYPVFVPSEDLSSIRKSVWHEAHGEPRSRLWMPPHSCFTGDCVEIYEEQGPEYGIFC